MELTSTKEDQLQIVTVQSPRIDATVALQFKDGVRDASDGGHDTVLLDLQQVNFIDSSGLGAIVAAMKSLAPARKLVLAGLTPTVEKVFRLTRMDSVFSLYPQLDDALAALRK
ncbi:MAG: STAS domain-containing protein [Sulfitobacter sp.]